MALASIGDLFGEDERGRIFGIIGAVQVLANLVGPPLGGWITDTFSWRWGFYLVVPIGVLAIILALFGLQDKSRSTNWLNLHVDWFGALLIGSGLCVGLLRFQWISLGSGYLIYGFAFCLAAIVFLGSAIFWEQRQSEPVIPITLLSHPLLWRATLGTLLLGFVTNGAVAYFPLYLEKIHGQTATTTGLSLLPMLLLAGVGSSIGGALSNRWPRQTQAIAWIFVVAGFSMLTATMTDAIAWMAAVIGMGAGLLLPVYLKSAQQAGGESHLATASGLIQMARNMGGAMGIPLLGVWLSVGEIRTTMFASIFSTLAAIGVLGFLLGFASPQQSQHSEQSLSTN